MRVRTFISVLALALVLGACGQKGESTTAATSTASDPVATVQTLTPEQLGELGARIEKKPDAAHELLSQHGLDEASFERQIRTVSSDPQASRRYRDAYVKAKS